MYFITKKLVFYFKYIVNVNQLQLYCSTLIIAQYFKYIVNVNQLQLKKIREKEIITLSI